MSNDFSLSCWLVKYKHFHFPSLESLRHKILSNYTISIHSTVFAVFDELGPPANIWPHSN